MAPQTNTPARRWKVVGAAVAAAAMALVMAVAVPARAADSPGALHGLKGEYYAINPGTFDFLGSPVSTVLDWDLDYDSMTSLYQQRVGDSENAGVRWTGFLTAPETGDYTFNIIGDNGFRLWIGDPGKSHVEDSDDPIIDFWVNEWEVPQSSAPVTLTAGQRVPFRMDLFQATGGANIHVTWVTPGGEETKIPLSALTVPDDFDVPRVTGTVDADGTQVTMSAPDVFGRVTSDVAGDLNVTVDSGQIPVESVLPGEGGTSLLVTVSTPILEGAGVRVSYDGDGPLTMGGEPLGAFDTPVTNTSTYTMSTQWADDVDPDAPLPDYPRPQMVREAWKNLNGHWQFQESDASFAVPFGADLDDEVVVPYPVESELSGIGHQVQHMIYRKTFHVPAGWNVGSGQRLILNFGAVDYHAQVYVNGQEVADHVGGYEAFSVDITDALQPAGENELVLHITDMTRPDRPHGKQSSTPSGIFYTPTSGIWQTVWMEPVAAAHLTRLDLTPDVDHGTLQVAPQATGTSGNASVTVVVYDHSKNEVGRMTGPASTTLDVPITQPHLWSPDDPYLYDLTVTLSDGGSTDTVSSYSGLRKIEIKKNAEGVNRIFLNGVQTFLLSTLDQGFWPDGVYTAPTDEALAWDIQKTKDLGFNTIRKHIKVEPARWYYHADKIGMMIWQDMPAGSGRLTGADAQQAFKNQLDDMVEQLKSHTAIIGWIPFNEGWGEWDKAATGQIADNVKALDPSRLVDAHSGVNCCNSLGDSGKGDVIDWHQYTGPGAPQPDATRAAVDGEHGGFSLSIPGRVWPGGSVNPYGELPTKEELTKAYVRNTAALVAPAQTYLSGSVYTQLTDVEGEVNGFYTYDRAVLKMDEDAVRNINQKVIEVGSGDREIPPSTTGTAGVAAWSFDEGTGNTSADMTGHHHTLTLHNGATWDNDTPRGDGWSLGLDGEDAYATAHLPDLDTTASYSVQARVRMDGYPDNFSTMVAMDGVAGRSPFFLQYGSGLGDGRYSFSFAADRAFGGVTPALGTWHEVVGVRDAEAGTLKLYVDGSLEASEHSAAGVISDGTLNLGRAQWDFDGADYFNGALDEVKVYDVALTPDQVSAVSGTLVTPAASTMSSTGVVSVPSISGVDYDVEVDGSPVTGNDGTVALAPGQKAVVTATPAPGYSFPVSATTTSWTHTYLAELTAKKPKIKGKAKVGKTLKAKPKKKKWTPGTTFTYRWFADGKRIKRATTKKLTLKAKQKHTKIKVKVTGHKKGYANKTKKSKATKKVKKGKLTAKKPKIKGKAKVGKTLKAKPKKKKWTPGTTFTYRWFADSKRIKRATTKKLTLKAKQKHTKIKVKVTGHKKGYANKTKKSKATKKVKG